MVKGGRMMKGCEWISLLELVLLPTQCLKVLLILKYLIRTYLSHLLVVLLIEMQILEYLANLLALFFLTRLLGLKERSS